VVGAWFLTYVPDARTVALGSAGVALNDLDANTYYNPASVVSGPPFAATWTHTGFRPWLVPGMSRDHAGFAGRLSDRLGLAASVLYSQYGQTEVIDGHGHYLGAFRTWDFSPSVSAAYGITSSMSAGLTAKGIYSSSVPDWVLDSMPELGIDLGGQAFTAAVDAGVQYRPLNALTLGFAVANLGPNLCYDTSAEYILPRIARIGFAARPPIPGPVSALLTSEVSRDLYPKVARFAWHAGAGLELGFSRLAFFRLGYFYDDRVWRGWTWGAGLQHRGVKLDVGVDSGFWGEPSTRDVEFQLSGRI
jgi:hypothetical protein